MGTSKGISSVKDIGGCSFGEKLTLQDLDALAEIAADGGSVKINGVRLTRADLQVLAEAVSQGARFCLIRKASWGP
jgi:hypothetical protein